MNLDFSEEQEMLRSAVRDLLDDHCPLSVVREMEDDPIGYPKALWEQMGKLDLLGIMIPEAYGGSGMTMLEGAVIYEELGRSLAPTPHFVSAVMSAAVIASGASDDLKSQWLPRIASGEAILTPAWLEPDAGFGPLGVQTQAVADGAGFSISGTKRHVLFAHAAERLVVLARTGPKANQIDLFLVDPKAAGVKLTQQFSIASDTQYQVDLDAVKVNSVDRIGTAGSGWSLWQAAMMDGLILNAAYAGGASQYALEITVQYAKDRHQFDKPLGAFQALAHYLADAQTEVDGAIQLVHEAAWARSTGRSIATLAPMSKLFACKAFRDLTAMAQQIFGGIGFTVEFDIQLYFRRAKALQLSWWNDRYLEELIASALLDS
ncbi:MAG TPA: acyl-CoA dehydrogenase family protein [Acidimicrobiales bacterium]|nr:acyl-CoA dehydrogenase family protein [Acidimicrobiales bacterium]